MEVTPDWKPVRRQKATTKQWRAWRENLGCMTEYCDECGAELPGPCSGGCSDEINPAGREGFDSLVDRLMYEKGFDRPEAEQRAVEIMEEDAA